MDVQKNHCSTLLLSHLIAEICGQYIVKYII